MEELINSGAIILRPETGDGHRSADDGERTILVTGVARSGTTMVAHTLRAAGLFMGSDIDDLVQEDREFLDCIKSGDEARIRRMILARNTIHATWGAKIPSLHLYLRVGDLRGFRNPYLVVLVRDLVAVAKRNVISEFRGELDALQDALDGVYSMLGFVRHAQCPTLLLSYEKALGAPESFIDVLFDFCGLPVSGGRRGAALAMVRPNDPAYVAGARRPLNGRVEGIAEGHLYGWCHQIDSLDPLSLDILIDGRHAMTVVANVYREDLLLSGIGNGNHGFFVSIDALGASPDAVISVRVAGLTFALENSGRTLADYDVRTEPDTTAAAAD